MSETHPTAPRRTSHPDVAAHSRVLASQASPANAAAAVQGGRTREPLRFAHYALTAGQFGASAGQTLIVALLPVLIRKYASSNFWIGFAVGGEGLFALALPFLVGIATDRLPLRLARRFGRHSFFLLLATPPMALALSLIPFLSGYWPMTGATFCFFAAQHTYQTPLMTLVIAAVPDGQRARLQAVRSIYHAMGLAYGLVAAGLLYSIWKPLPFVAGAGFIVVCTAITWWAEQQFPRASGEQASESLGAHIKQLLSVLKKTRAAAWLLVANALWNGAVDGIRPYFFVFAIVVVGLTVAQTSLALIALVASIVTASAVFGELGDKHDRARLLEYGAVLAIAAMAVGYFVRGPWLALLVLVVAGVGAAAMTTLPYPLFASLMGERGSGQYSGLFVVSLSLGRVGSPMLIGAAIDLGARALPHAKGYPFMWPAAGVLAAFGWLALWRAKRARDG